MPVSLDVARGFKYGTSAQFQLFGKELQNAVRSFDKLPPTLCHGKPCVLWAYYNCDTSTIRVRFDYDSATTRYEVFRALAYEIVYENQW